jgi:hypothetical protein
MLSGFSIVVLLRKRRFENRILVLVRQGEDGGRASSNPGPIARLWGDCTNLTVSILPTPSETSLTPLPPSPSLFCLKCSHTLKVVSIPKKSSRMFFPSSPQNRDQFRRQTNLTHQLYFSYISIGMTSDGKICLLKQVYVGDPSQKEL